MDGCGRPAASIELGERAVDLVIWSVLSLAASLALNLVALTLFSSAVLGAIVIFLFIAVAGAEQLPIPNRWRERMQPLLSSIRGLPQRPRLLAAMAGLTLINCGVTVLVTAVLFDGVGVVVPLAFVAAVALPVIFAALLPFTVAGMGTGDSVLILLFSSYANPAQALSVGLLFALFFRWLLSLLGTPVLQRIGKNLGGRP